MTSNPATWPTHLTAIPQPRDREAAARHGRFIPVRVIGVVNDIDGVPLRIGIDYDSVTIGDCRFTLARMEEVAQAVVSAVWAAGANAAAMAQEAPVPP